MDNSTQSEGLSSLENLNPAADNPTPETVTGYVRRVIGHEVTIQQGAATSIEADSAVVRQGAAVILKTNEAEFTSSACGYTQAGQVVLNSSKAAVVVTRNQANLDQSAARVLVSAGDVHLKQSAAVVSISKNVEVHEKSSVVFLIAQSVTGDVHPLFGSKEAAVFGAAAGLVGGFVILASKLLHRKP
jgi:hypothetical protein